MSKQTFQFICLWLILEEQWVAIVFFDLAALSDEYLQETPHWLNLITNSLKLFWSAGLNLMRIPLIEVFQHGYFKQVGKVTVSMGFPLVTH